MKRRSREWYIHHATRAAHESADPVERNKHAKILLDIHIKGFDDETRPYRSSQEFLDIVYAGIEKPPQIQMARRAIDYVTFTNTDYVRPIYIGRHTDSDPAFLLGNLTNGWGHRALRVPAVSRDDRTHRAIALDEEHVSVLAGENQNTLVRAGVAPILQGRFDYNRLNTPELFTQDDESPTHILFGRKAIGKWVRAAAQDGEGLEAEYAEQTKAALQFWNVQ